MTEAYWQGRDAYSYGKDIHTNPFELDYSDLESEAFYNWEKGWLDAFHEEES